MIIAWLYALRNSAGPHRNMRRQHYKPQLLEQHVTGRLLDMTELMTISTKGQIRLMIRCQFTSDHGMECSTQVECSILDIH